MKLLRPLVALTACSLVLFGCASTDSKATPQAAKPAQGDSSGPAPGQAAARDPQQSYEPRSEPGEGQKYLARMEGDWDVVKTFYPRSGDPAVSQGTCNQHMIHAGRFLESDFIFHDKAGDTDGMGIIGFDPQAGNFTSFWTDSRSTRISIRQSEDPFDGTQIVLLSKAIGDPGPNARKSRTVSVLEDGDRRLIHRQYAPTPEGGERIMMQLEMTRRN